MKRKDSRKSFKRKCVLRALEKSASKVRSVQQMNTNARKALTSVKLNKCKNSAGQNLNLDQAKRRPKSL